MSRTISNTITTGLTLVPGDTPLTIANTGVVSYGVTGSTALYGPAGTTWIVTNLGTISDTGAGWGVNFAADGTVINGRLIAADVAANSAIGVYLSVGGSVTNQSGGTINWHNGVKASNVAATVVNAGRINLDSTSAAQGVLLNAGGSVTNQSGGVILGYDSVLIQGGTSASVVNAGSIGAINRGIALDVSGSVTNLSTGTITSSGLAPGGPVAGTAVSAGIYKRVTLVNAGSIGANASYGVGIYFAYGQLVSNQAGGVITALNAVRLGRGTVINAGSIGGNTTYGTGVSIASAGGIVTNQSGGTIAGQVAVKLNRGTVVNAGVIAGDAAGYGVSILGAVGTVTNQAGGAISGFVGVQFIGGTATNAGVITGYTLSGYGFGMRLFGRGTVSNLSTGTIRASTGVTLASGILENAGTIVGVAGTAVAFSATAANRVIVDPGAVFSGIVDGGNTIGATFASTLELASGASAGTLSGLGTQFVHFAAITIDSGASWTLGGTNTVATGSTFTDSGTLINSGTVTGSKIRLSGGALTNQASGLLTVAYVYGVAAGGTDTVVNAGTIASSAANAIYLAAAGNVSNAANGAIGGYGDGVKLKGVNATLNNLGRITGSAPAGSYGAYLRNGGLVTNGQAGTGTSTASLRGYYGVAFKTADTVNAIGTLFNYGSVTGYGSASSAVLMDNAGIVVNGASGAGAALIQGGRFGVSAGFATITNYATILATGTAGGNYGVFVSNTGIVRNLGSASSIRGYGGVQIGTDGTVINAGTIASSQGTTGVAVSFIGGNARLIDNPGAVFVGTVNGGSGGTAVLELASGSSAGTISGLGTSITNFTSLVFDAGARWTVQANASAAGLGTLAISGFSDNDTIDLSGFVAVDETFADNQLVLTNASSAHVTLGVQGTFTTSNFALASDLAGGTDITVICFDDDTMIATPAGEVPVQDLAAGNLVMTAHNGPRPVQWIGKGKVLSTRGRRTAATPVIVYKNALGPNLPHNDLRITKAHSLYIDNVLIPVEFLVNHRTIVWDDRAQEVEIYHVELGSHDILIANGVPAESYRDDGNRWLFQNANSGWGLPPQTPYAPVLTGGPVVDAVWARLLAMAGPRSLPPLTDDPDLHLIADGVRVDVAASEGQDRVFFVSGTPDSIRIVSRDTVPAEFGIARDPRSLGVAVREIAMERGLSRLRIAADDPRLSDGFHDYEPSDNLRWTNGDASLPVALSGPGALRIVLTLAAATRYLELGHAMAA